MRATEVCSAEPAPACRAAGSDSDQGHPNELLINTCPRKVSVGPPWQLRQARGASLVTGDGSHHVRVAASLPSASTTVSTSSVWPCRSDMGLDALRSFPGGCKCVAAVFPRTQQVPSGLCNQHANLHRLAWAR